jgi:hypothetical protein
VEWQALVDGHEEDDPVVLEPDAPADPVPGLELLTTGDDVEGFVLTLIFNNPRATVALLDRQGRMVWWQDVESASAFRALYDPASRSVTWLDLDVDGQSRLWRCALDGQPEQVATLPHSHHDFTTAPDGGWYVLAYDPREVDLEGEVQTIYGDEVVHVSADGSEVEQVWSSWDEFPFTETVTAMASFNGLEYPHTNSVVVDAATGDLVLSLYLLDALIAVDPASGSTRWQMGGEGSDWQVDVPFAHQHSPLLVQDGGQLALFDNGSGDEADPAEAALYTLDWERHTATRTWDYDEGGAHLDVTMGSAVPTAEDDLLVAWGSDAELTRVSPEGEVRWAMAWDGDSFGYTALVDDLAGASW